MRRELALAVLFLASAATFAQSARTDHGDVYDAVLRHYGKDFERRHKTRAMRLIIDQTTLLRPESLGYARKELPEALADALLAANREPISLGRYVPPEPHLRISVQADDDWRKRYPAFDGTLTFSVPVYAGTEAVVYFETYCGNLCGEGNVYWLRRADGEWKVQKSFMPWVS